MFVRRTQTRATANGERYFTHRLVCSERSGTRVQQRTLLNLGRHFDLPQSAWPLLCSCVKQILSSQYALPLAEVPREIEQTAQHIAAQLLVRQVELPGAAKSQGNATHREFHSIDVDSLELLRPRSVGVEQVGLWAMEQVQLLPLLNRLGFNGPQCAAAVGSIIGRMAAPGSERATYRWLAQRSALGELLEVDFESMSMMQLYRVSDLLATARKPIEHHLFDQVTDLFGLEVTVTLYDLTNTYFEGVAADQPLAQHGHSKEKRTDCPLLTLGLVVDGSGFVRRSEVMAGNIVEGEVLQGALKRLEVPAGALIVMDCGAATEKNLKWLREQGYRYLVASRERTRRFDGTAAMSIPTAGRQQIQVQQVVSEDGSEVRLYCYSPAREGKEQAMLKKATTRFEKRLAELHEGLSRPRTHKKIEAIWKRIGRLKAKSSGAGQHYHIEVEADDSGQNATAIRCESAGKVTPGRRSKGPPSLGLHVTLYSGASFESSYGGRWESCHSSASASPERSIKVRNRCRDGGHKDGGSAVVQAAVEVTVGVAAVEQRVARGCERRASGQPARLRVECRPRDVDKPAGGGRTGNC